MTIFDIIIEGTITLQGSDITTLLNNISANNTTFNNHITNTSNPHSTTKAQVGLGNVDNTSDLNKPISTATQTALNGKENSIVAGTTSQYYRGDKTFQVLDKTAVGLGNVDNTSDANKPVSTAQAIAIGLKEDSANKSTLTSESASTTKFPVWSAIVSYFSASQIRSILGITTLSGSNTGDNAVNSLYSGLVSNATHTGDVTGDTALTIANNTVTNAKAANMAVNTIKGRITTGTGDPEDLSATQVRTIINVADGATANSSDASLRDRATHTGTQTASTISDFAATVRSTILTGLGAFTNVAILATDSILSAMSKLQGQINAKANISGQVFTGSISATNLSNTNTGDETTLSIQTKRPLKTINGSSLEGAGNIVISGGAGSTSFFTKRLISNQSTTANTPISLVGQSFEIPPGHCLTIWGNLIFTSAAVNTGASYGLNVLQETGADANAVGSFLTYVNLSSAPAATGLSDGDVINVAQNSNTNYMTLGTASVAGNNSAFICATIYNLSTNGTTFVTMAFNSETSGTAVTAQANSSATALLGPIQ
jgi:hypothetical protein